jgi:hypothetical protein
LLEVGDFSSLGISFAYREKIARKAFEHFAHVSMSSLLA